MSIGTGSCLIIIASIIIIFFVQVAGWKWPFSPKHCVLITKFKLESLKISSHLSASPNKIKQQKWPISLRSAGCISHCDVQGNTGLSFSPLCYSTDIFFSLEGVLRLWLSSQHDTSMHRGSMRSADIVLRLSAAPDIPTPGIWLLHSPRLSCYTNSSPETPAARWVTEQRKQFKESSVRECWGSLRGVKTLQYRHLLLDLWKVGHRRASRFLSRSPRPQSGRVNSMVLHTTFTPICASADNTKRAGHKLWSSITSICKTVSLFSRTAYGGRSHPGWFQIRTNQWIKWHTEIQIWLLQIFNTVLEGKNLFKYTLGENAYSTITAPFLSKLHFKL